MYKVENGNVIADEEKKHSNSRINVFKKEWVKFLIILVASICIAIIGIINNINRDLKKEYRDFVELELKNSLREDTLRNLKHEIDNESNELFYNVFESIEYKQNGENVRHCSVIVENLDKVFEEELEGLYKQIFGNNSDKNNVLLVFPKEPEEVGYRPSFRLENGLNEQILIIKDGEERNYADGIIY